jgi:hypothetical protein
MKDKEALISYCLEHKPAICAVHYIVDGERTTYDISLMAFRTGEDDIVIETNLSRDEMIKSSLFWEYHGSKYISSRFTVDK